MKAIIFCGGKIEDYSYIRKEDFKESLIICADGGLFHTEKIKIKPDVVVGDNDSWPYEYPKDITVINCPAEKDYTDTKRCIDYAIEKGFTEILIYGGLGGRLDHEFSNYCLLSYALERGIKVILKDKHNEIWMENKPFEIKKKEKKYISFFPYGGVVKGFSVKGLKYEAENMTLNVNSTVTTSNEFKEDIAEVSFSEGTLLVMVCDDI